jgi:DNA mismatch endonuclease (patch repair protein)
MQATPSRDTGPEKTLRSTLQRMGLRFRKDEKPIDDIDCKADVIFQSAKVCVFVDGCFWHGCPRHFRPPKINTEWWMEKVRDNQERDKKKTKLIKKRGWVVLRYWEHAARHDNVIKIAERISAIVRERLDARA